MLIQVTYAWYLRKLIIGQTAHSQWPFLKAYKTFELQHQNNFLAFKRKYPRLVFISLHHSLSSSTVDKNPWLKLGLQLFELMLLSCWIWHPIVKFCRSCCTGGTERRLVRFPPGAGIFCISILVLFPKTGDAVLLFSLFLNDCLTVKLNEHILGLNKSIKLL